MKRIFFSLFTILAIASLAAGATVAYFADSETSGSVFTGGVLDLTCDGANGADTAKFNIADLQPNAQISGKYTLANIGNVNGFLDLENIAVVNFENDCLEPETQAGDASCGNPGPGDGELQNLVNAQLFVDADCSETINGSEAAFYNGDVKDLPAGFDLNEPINSAGSLCLAAIFNWTSSAGDALAQSDSFTLNITFELGQTSGQ